MGTRNLTCVVKDGEYRVAQYCQWDGYPEGQGVDILRFLRSDKVEKLKENLDRCSLISNEQYKKLYDEFAEDEKEAFLKLYPQFSRDVGAEILTMIAELDYDVESLLLYDDYEFAGDSIFCEWAYVIDFDKNAFEVYEGFNREALDETARFVNLQGRKSHTGEQYYPVRISKTFDLSSLPTHAEFIAAFENDENEQQEAM